MSILNYFYVFICALIKFSNVKQSNSFANPYERKNNDLISSITEMSFYMIISNQLAHNMRNNKRVSKFVIHSL